MANSILNRGKKLKYLKSEMLISPPLTSVKILSLSGRARERNKADTNGKGRHHITSSTDDKYYTQRTLRTPAESSIL